MAYGPAHFNVANFKWQGTLVPEHKKSVPLSSFCTVPSKVPRNLVLKVVKLLQRAIPAPGYSGDSEGRE